MTERLNHKLDIDTIQTLEDVKNVLYTMELVASVDVDNPIYEVAKKYFTIPYVPPKLEGWKNDNHFPPKLDEWNETGDGV